MEGKLPEWAYRSQYINLTTFRRNGQAVATPVWFVALNGRLYISTNVNSGKAKRIRANGKASWHPVMCAAVLWESSCPPVPVR